MRAFEEDAAIAGAAGGPYGLELAAGPALCVMRDVRDGGGRGDGGRVGENPSFVEFDFVVDGVFGCGNGDDAVRALRGGDVADGEDLCRQTLLLPGFAVVAGERDVSAVFVDVLLVIRVVVGDEEETAGGEADDAGGARR